MNENFDERAKTWDDDPAKKERAELLATEIISNLKPNKSWRALEFGAGTGLVSFALKDYFNRIDMIDISAGMIEVARDKINRSGANNLSAFQLDILNDSDLKEQYHVIYTLLSMHHVMEVEKVIKKLGEMLLNNRYLCIADLITEDGSFHGPESDFTGHKGFSQSEIENYFIKNGFKLIHFEIFHHIERIVEDKKKLFPLFFAIGQKSG